MKIILNNGTELNPILITGEKRYVQGATRDCLTFVFEETSLDAIDAAFSESNCENINTIGDDGEESLKKGYVIRVDLTKTVEEKSPATATEPAENVVRVSVTMAERTYAEAQMVNLTETVDYLVLESLMA